MLVKICAVGFGREIDWSLRVEVGVVSVWFGDD